MASAGEGEAEGDGGGLGFFAGAPGWQAAAIRSTVKTSGASLGT